MRAIDADALQKQLTKKKPGPANARYTEGFNDALLRFKSMIHSAPTIEPQRKKGMWIEHNPHKWGLGIVFECSECGEKIDCEPSNFCPNCGAEMLTEGEE